MLKVGNAYLIPSPKKVTILEAIGEKIAAEQPGKVNNYVFP